MLSEEVVNSIEKQIIKSLIDSLYKINKLTKKEYKNIINELITL